MDAVIRFVVDLFESVGRNDRKNTRANLRVFGGNAKG